MRTCPRALRAMPRCRPHPKGDVMDSRLKDLAERLDAGLIGRREFLRKAAVVTGGSVAGLTVLRRMAHAQSGTKLRIWLFKELRDGGQRRARQAGGGVGGRAEGAGR